ncbi:4'-phosphopantetheinyl transferase [Streptomyces ruber]|uniref:4'-phosphopantetheinyl transferase n=2 Tax=Streptomyces TaxID=1883 RepID=A0A918BBE7_9ACTN|nr:4'-phosphopantetheinyl transferase superfamily protein [Streptomyces ruber]GGQ52580.1 4'-phosphopantetheinyl transferase [Streptomyces ruber]
MIDKILPATVRWSESFTHRTDIGLFPEEQAAVARAVDKRRNEFTTVRACAREALAGIGHPPVPLVPGERGAPGWPAGVVGSMTHCAGYYAAVVARETDVATVGIDAEPHAALPEGVLEAIARPEDLTVLATLPSSAGVAFDRVLFSAKESVYKAWFPVARTFLDFQQATVALAADGTFTARVLVPGPDLLGRPLTGFSGRWIVDGGIVATAITVERDA